jgi:hypothetical protein
MPCCAFDLLAKITSSFSLPSFIETLGKMDIYQREDTSGMPLLKDEHNHRSGRRRRDRLRIKELPDRIRSLTLTIILQAPIQSSRYDG